MSYIPPTPEDYARFSSQKLAVLAHLQSGASLTQNEAKARWGIMRLASRVDELRREGWNVLTNMVSAGDGGADVAEYSLGQAARRKPTSVPYLPVIPEGIPEELKALPQWVTWRELLRVDRKTGEKKPTKVPYTVDGWRKAESNNPDTWGSFDDAFRTYAAGHADGIGFMFASGGGLVGIDLDKCVNETGEPTPQAKMIVRDLNSYTELSVSGTGLHVIVRASLAQGKRFGLVEIYPSGRYFTVTGHVFDGLHRVEERQSAADRLIKVMESLKRREAPAKNTRAAPKPQRYLRNDELIEKAISAKNGAKFTRLWNGDTSGYSSHSEADLALLSILLYWTNGDEDRASLLFSQSGLTRDKWGDREDYRRRCFEYLRGGGRRHDGLGQSFSRHHRGGAGGGKNAGAGAAAPSDKRPDHVRTLQRS